MIINIEFTTSRGYKYETMRTEFDRNYRDEETAMIFVESEEDDFKGYFEVNIRKDKQGKAISEGYVCEYASSDDNDPQTIYNDVKIDVTLHDFDGVLEMANTDLLNDGLRIVLEYDGECYWAIGTEIKATGEIKWFAENDFEDEVQGDIFECLAHAKAMADAMRDGKYEEPKLYAVTYVGLSDSEYDADGYSEVAICDSLDKAKAKLKSWRDNEIADLEEQEREYEILQDEDNKCRISWCSHGEQVRIEIHEVEMNK
jgi:hypothetical protein